MTKLMKPMTKDMLEKLKREMQMEYFVNHLFFIFDRIFMLWVKIILVWFVMKILI